MNTLECLYRALIGLVIVINTLLGQLFILNIQKHKLKKEFLEKEIELMDLKIKKAKEDKK